MVSYGEAVIQETPAGPVVVSADDRIGISIDLLAVPDVRLAVQDDGSVLLLGDPAHRYRPVGFVARSPGGPPVVLVCDRVDGA